LFVSFMINYFVTVFIRVKFVVFVVLVVLHGRVLGVGDRLWSGSVSYPVSLSPCFHAAAKTAVVMLVGTLHS
jgi:hypothetical protein